MPSVLQAIDLENDRITGLAFHDPGRSNAAGLDRARTLSRLVKLRNFVIEAGRRIGQGLTHIFVFQFGVLRVKLFAIRVCGQCFKYASDSQPQAVRAEYPTTAGNKTNRSGHAGMLRTPTTSVSTSWKARQDARAQDRRQAGVTGP